MSAWIEMIGDEDADGRLKELLDRARMLIDAGLLREGRGHLRLTAAGQPLHGEVAARLI